MDQNCSDLLIDGVGYWWPGVARISRSGPDLVKV